MDESASTWPVGDVIFGDSCVVGPDTSIGLVREAHARSIEFVPSEVVVGDHCLIGAGVVIHEGTELGLNVFIDDRTRIGFNCKLGDGVRVEYGATICDRVTIGENTVIAGFVGDGVTIGTSSIVMGQLVHELTRPTTSKWGIEEPAAEIGDHVVVGMGATVVGGIKIADYSYVAAGAVVTKSMPPQTVAIGVNQFVPRDEWWGERLERIEPD